MIRGIIKIVLAGVLALPLCGWGAQTGNHPQRSRQVPRGTLEVLDSLDERIRLGRSVMEFAQEFSLFDDQLYGRLAKNNDQQERIAELNYEIKTTNDRLAQVNSVLLVGGGGDNALLPGSDREIRAEVDQLESQLTIMKGQIKELMIGSLLPGENMILEISRWDDLLVSGATRDILELIEKSLESTRNEKVPVSNAKDR